MKLHRYGPNKPVTIPCGAVKADWEVELGTVIGSKAHLIFGIPKPISYINQFMTLHPGDHIRLGIQGLGEQNQTCVPAP
jgi:2-keto-4-pentenoate hydratase/2-oxohepta-3-ene-1,7-dioic acid hydratase in catechol pathway